MHVTEGSFKQLHYGGHSVLRVVSAGAGGMVSAQSAVERGVSF